MRVENHLDAVKDLKSKLEGKREKLFNADHQLKKYASNEHQHWVSTIGEIDDLLKEAEKYTNQITFYIRTILRATSMMITNTEMTN